MNKRMFASAAALAVGTCAWLAPAAIAATHVSVAPRVGTQKTRFVVRFHAPNATTSTPPVRSHYEILASTARGKRCSSSVSRTVGPTDRGAPVRMTLAPGGSRHVWCAGRYSGSVVEIINRTCGTPFTQIICPLIEVAPITIARFSFRVMPPALQMKAIADRQRSL
jgi:hypothetical protein